MAKEADIERYFRSEVKKRGGVAWKWVSPGTPGVPDRIVLFYKEVHFVELKAPGGKLRPLQKLVHMVMKALGHEVEVISSKEEVDKWLAKIGKR